MSKTKIGLIGIGNIIDNHLLALKANPAYELMGVCRRSPDKLKAQANALGIEGYCNYHDMLSDKPDVVLISLPHNLHFQAALDALEAGCHVLMEKPVAVSIKEINILSSVMQKVQKLIVPTEISYWQPCFRTARRIVKNSGLGKFLFANFTNHRFYFTSDRPRWFLSSKTSGGGQFMNIGVHRAAAVRCVIGDAYEEKSVTASVHSINPDYDIETAVKALVMYKGGEGVTYEECGLFTPPAELSKGLHFVFENGLLGISSDKVWTSDVSGHVTNHDLLTEPSGGVYGALYGEMLKAINGEQYYPTFKHGAKDARIALAAYASADQKCAIDLESNDWQIL